MTVKWLIASQNSRIDIKFIFFVVSVHFWFVMDLSSWIVFDNREIQASKSRNLMPKETPKSARHEIQTHSWLDVSKQYHLWKRIEVYYRSWDDHGSSFFQSSRVVFNFASQKNILKISHASKMKNCFMLNPIGLVRTETIPIKLWHFNFLQN